MPCQTRLMMAPNMMLICWVSSSKAPLYHVLQRSEGQLTALMSENGPESFQERE